MAKAGSSAGAQRAPKALAWGALAITLWQIGCTEPTFVDDAGLDAEQKESVKDDGGRAQPKRDAASPARSGEDSPDAAQPDLDAGADQNPENQRDAEQAAATEGGSPPASDASMLMTTGDAGLSTATLPQWAQPLIGTYAKRSVTFSYDDDLSGSDDGKPFNTRNVEFSIVKISRNGNDLDLNFQLCKYTVSLRYSSVPVVFKTAARTPSIKGRILLGETNHFTSSELLSHLGFDPSPERTSMCTAGGRRAKWEDQTWITSTTTCQCSSMPLPDSTSDCRVVDTDNDGKPAITVNGPSVLTTSGTTDYVMVFDYAFKFVDGELHGTDAPTLRETRRQSAGCPANDGCGVGHNQLCANKVGSTKLLRVAAETTCAEINEGDFGPPDEWIADHTDCRN